MYYSIGGWSGKRLKIDIRDSRQNGTWVILVDDAPMVTSGYPTEEEAVAKAHTMFPPDSITGT